MTFLTLIETSAKPFTAARINGSPVPKQAFCGFLWLALSTMQRGISTLSWPNKLAISKLRFYRNYADWLTDSLTGVRCRATSVAKNPTADFPSKFCWQDQNFEISKSLKHIVLNMTFSLSKRLIHLLKTRALVSDREGKVDQKFRSQWAAFHHWQNITPCFR